MADKWYTKTHTYTHTHTHTQNVKMKMLQCYGTYEYTQREKFSK